MARTATNISLQWSDIQIWAVEIKDWDSETRLDVELDSSKNSAFVQSESLAQESWGNLDTIAWDTTSIDTKFWEVQATPTSNTLLGRLKDLWDKVASVITTIWSTEVQRVAIFDDSDAQITSFGSPSTISTHRSPVDFTATYASSTTITLSNNDTITDDSQIVYIRYVPAGWSGAAVLVNGSWGVTLTESSWVITVNWWWAPFASGDFYEVGINFQDKAYDPDLNTLNNSPQSNAPKVSWSESYTSFTPTGTTYVEGEVLDTRADESILLQYSKTLASLSKTLIKVVWLDTISWATDYQESYEINPSSWITEISTNVYRLKKDAIVSEIEIKTKWKKYIRIDVAKEEATWDNPTMTCNIVHIPR